MSKARHKKSGGRTDMWVSGNPDVKKEAEGKEDYADGDERKRGGKMMKKKRAAGGKIVGRAEGGAVRTRMDRPGRKRGGAVGSNRSPLSTAHSASSAPEMPKESGGN